MSDMSNATIVVADDFSEQGHLAVTHALDLGRALHADLHVVHVITARELEAAAGVTRIEKQDTLLQRIPPMLWDRVGSAGSSVSGLAEMHVTVHVRLGTPAEEIDRIAADYDAKLIVVGTHGRKGLERLVLGSVAETLIRSAHCSVQVVRPRDFDLVRKSEVPEPPRPGEELHDERPEHPHVYRSSQIISFHDVETQGVRY